MVEIDRQNDNVKIYAMGMLWQKMTLQEFSDWQSCAQSMIVEADIRLHGKVS